MNIRSNTVLPASSSVNNDPATGNQQIIDRLVNAAGKGNIDRVISVVTTGGLGILSASHSKTGNTALHAAIQNGRAKVVGTITCLLTQLQSVDTINLQTLLDLKNKENHSPLTTGELTPRIKTELLAGLSDLWPLCSTHGGYCTSTFLKECGCRVCWPCGTSLREGANCTTCSRYLNTNTVRRDHENILQTLQNVRKYSVLFDGNDLPVCLSCAKLAFPPLAPKDCLHIQCFNCLGGHEQERACTARIDDSGNICRQPISRLFVHTLANEQFIRLFSTQTQYSGLPVLVNRTMNPSSTSTNPVREDQSIGVYTKSAGISVIDGMTVERCVHIPGRLDRYAVPVAGRTYKDYYDDDLEQSLKIEELEYRLEPSIDKVRKKLETALANARKQHETQQKEALVSAGPTQVELLTYVSDTYLQDVQDVIDPSLPSTICEMPAELPGVSIASSIGWKDTMEDTHIAANFIIKAGGKDVPVRILGVFDGHGETDMAARHAMQNIIFFLTQQLELYNADGLTERGIWNALKIGFVNLNLDYSAFDSASDSASDSAFDPAFDCDQTEYGGTTACVALIINNVLWVANLGDSRAILINRNGEDIQLSEDAKAGDEIYKHSIEKRDGTVIFEGECDRIEGMLEPARALGDHELCGAASARPKITRYPLTGFSGCLVLVSDGVTDTMIAPNLEIGSLVRTMLQKMPNPESVNLASRIVRKSLRARDGDNITAIVALLGGPRLAECSTIERLLGTGTSEETRHQRKLTLNWFGKRQHFSPLAAASKSTANVSSGISTGDVGEVVAVALKTRTNPPLP